MDVTTAGGWAGAAGARLGVELTIGRLQGKRENSPILHPIYITADDDLMTRPPGMFPIPELGFGTQQGGSYVEKALPRICGSRKKGPGPWGAGTPNGEALSAGANSFQNARLCLTGQLIPTFDHFYQV